MKSIARLSLLVQQRVESKPQLMSVSLRHPNRNISQVNNIKTTFL